MVSDASGAGLTSGRARDRLVRILEQQGIRDPRVLEAIRSVPRHLFVEEALSHRAYENIALPIGHRQTISQPFIVARMTEALLEGGPVSTVLEIGTGSGYQAAVLAQIVDRVYSIERIQALTRSARELLSRLGINNVNLRHGDGAEGWPEKTPYDGIILTAAPREVPETLLTQLAPGGRLVAPVEGPDGRQQLVRYTRTEEAFVRDVLDAVMFVPMLPGAEQ
ncbi:MULTISPECIES: protein-L-isoaspartate(D-aspartate) O-methyltransferase [Thioalkalivibrio]|uniref:Protein-L-isoaspartate O-methyltransferase n=1 Tax=Thioalkalivibrio halophilus TaxID=252474 RepID=A0A1V2ZYC7_9GAMM|nr:MULTISPECIES: protein-L-isoaspartate(D-aspartate) O-methyltransferase [Thioalkalivibrio]OOC10127.1 protein-L-isoaspartate O-methyltransferase [Thioalkalivibrio halophilus]PYG02735.1 protein-L-isoaspartate(D-aspartate) O-methyltransferase [Thioalkalivibrio sp. ALE21]